MNLKNLFLYGIVGGLLTSCHTMVEGDFPEFSRTPVINGTLVADSSISVQLTFSANLKDFAPPAIENALVTLDCSNGLTDTLHYTQNGWYKTNLIARTGFSYTCKAIVPGFEKVTAITNVPNTSVVESIKFTELAGMSEDGEPLASCRFTLINDTTQALYWQVVLLEFGEHSFYNTTLKRFEERFSYMPIDLIILTNHDPVMLNEAQPLTLFSNKKMKGTTHEIVFYAEKEDFKLDRKYDYYLVVQSVDEAYYKFKKQLYLYNTASFDEIGSTAQSYPLYSNVQNGLGIFNAMTITKYKIDTK